MKRTHEYGTLHTPYICALRLLKIKPKITLMATAANFASDLPVPKAEHILQMPTPLVDIVVNYKIKNSRNLCVVNYLWPWLKTYVAGTHSKLLVALKSIN